MFGSISKVFVTTLTNDSLNVSRSPPVLIVSWGHTGANTWDDLSRGSLRSITFIIHQNVRLGP